MVDKFRFSYNKRSMGCFTISFTIYIFSSALELYNSYSRPDISLHSAFTKREGKAKSNTFYFKSVCTSSQEQFILSLTQSVRPLTLTQQQILKKRCTFKARTVIHHPLYSWELIFGIIAFIRGILECNLVLLRLSLCEMSRIPNFLCICLVFLLFFHCWVERFSVKSTARNRCYSSHYFPVRSITESCVPLFYFELILYRQPSDSVNAFLCTLKPLQ